MNRQAQAHIDAAHLPVTRTVSLRPDQMASLRGLATRDCTTVDALIREAIDNHLKQQRRNGHAQR